MASLIEDILTGIEIEVPKVIADMLTDSEEVLHSVQQARMKELITPNNIFITNKRVIVHKPRMLGLRKNIEDFKYIDMSNTIIDHGIIHSTIRIKMRFQPNEIFLEGIPKKVSREIFKTIQEGVAGRLGSAEPTSPVPIIQNIKTKAEPEMHKAMNKKELLSLLQTRYVKGEISKDEYDSMKKELAGESYVKNIKRKSKN